MNAARRPVPRRWYSSSKCRHIMPANHTLERYVSNSASTPLPEGKNSSYTAGMGSHGWFTARIHYRLTMKPSLTGLSCHTEITSQTTNEVFLGRTLWGDSQRFHRVVQMSAGSYVQGFQMYQSATSDDNDSARHHHPIYDNTHHCYHIDRSVHNRGCDSLQSPRGDHQSQDRPGVGDPLHEILSRHLSDALRYRPMVYTRRYIYQIT